MAESPLQLAQSALQDAKHLAELAKGAPEPLDGIMGVQFLILFSKIEFVIEYLEKQAAG